jgi:two-component system, sensor histidine kinase and response regulator
MNNMRIKKLLSSEEPARIVLDCLSDIVLVLSKDWRQLLHINQRGVEFTGCPPNLQEGLSGWQDSILAMPSRPKFQQFMAALNANAAQTNRTLECPVIELKSIVGSSMPVRIHSALCCNNHWILIATSVANDSTADEVLRQSLARFRSIVDGLSINFVLKDVDSRIVYANQRFLDYNNWHLADVLGKSDEDLFPPELAQKFLEDDRKVIETGEVIHQFEENRLADGSPFWAEVIKGPLRDADNKITGLQVLFWDATQRKLTEQALELERHLLRTLLENVPDSIYFKDCDSRFTKISSGMIEKFGFADPDSVLGKTDADIFSAEHADQARRDELEIMRTEQPIIGLVERETWRDRPDTWSSTTKLPLRDANGQVVGTFGISRDITDLVKAEKQLRETRDLADKANRSKSEFLANMSHEIRTPMNGIIGMTELLSHSRLNDAQKSFVTMIEQSAQSLLRIINDILDFSKIEAGKLELEQAPFNLRQCVSHATKSLATRAAQHNTELILRISNDIPERLIGDEIRLRQVLVNLIGNAVKFTQGGEIVVRVSVADGPPAAVNYSLHFSVADTGIGIPVEKQSKIFEAFSQADLSTTREYGGTGLGLSISNQLVSLMGGRIWLESEPGVGSMFHFTGQFAPTTQTTSVLSEITELVRHLPVLIVDDNSTSRKLLAQSLGRRGLLTRETDSADEANRILDLYLSETPGPILLVIDQIMPTIDALELISDLQKKSSDRRLITLLQTTAAHPISEQQMERYHIDALLHKPALASEICKCVAELLNENRSEPAPISDEPALRKSGVRLRLLLAEDGAVNRAVFLGLLSEKGHEVTCVEDGEAAVEAWQEFDFDAIFMDVQMPILDGLEATQRIRDLEPDGQHIPIIAITAGAMADDQQRCLQSGMDDFLSKPIDFAQLNSVLRTLELHVGGRTSEWLDPVELPETSLLDSAYQLSQVVNCDAPLTKIKCSPLQQRELVNTLRNEAVQRIDEMASAFESHDDQLLVRASHSLKSAAALFEAKKVTEISAAMELAARQGDTQTASKHFSEMRTATAAMIDEIDRWLAITNESA